MNTKIIPLLILIATISLYSAEDRTFSLTFEGITLNGFDEIRFGGGINKNKFHVKFKLGGSYIRSNYKDSYTSNRIDALVGTNFGLILSPREDIELIPSIGFDFYSIVNSYKLSNDADKERDISYKFGPIGSFTFYKLFKKFIIGTSADIVVVTFEQASDNDWNSQFEIKFRPYLIIGYRF